MQWVENPLAFGAGTDDDGDRSERWVVVPLWMVVGLAGFLPAVRTVRWIRRRRRLRDRAAGLCSNCGYDLTGNLSGVCPECGSARR